MKNSYSNNNFEVEKLQTTIVGYGRYGNKYIGPKYAKNSYSWETVAVVDPLITKSKFSESVLGRKRPQTELFKSFEEWYENYFAKLDNNEKSRQVIEIALKPELVYSQALLYIEAGVKNIILPKPVVVNQKELSRLTELVKKHQVKAAVSSQWYYCQLPKFIKREIKRIAPNFYHKNGIPSIHKIEVDFSKENGCAYQTKPPLLELPHALQLVSSIGLADLSKDIPEVSGTDTAVNIVYRSEAIREGIHIHTNIDIKPLTYLKKQFPLWDIQERSLKIYLWENSVQPELEVDFWVKFDSSGELAIRPGKLRILDSELTDKPEILELTFQEDQLLRMNQCIYQAFAQNAAEFNNNETVLSLEKYGSIGQQIMQIMRLWEAAKNNNLDSGTKVGELLEV
ncbi:MAG: Gfo/Idh/MocA family oxidoreductase [Rivularia sp. (in: Bacteria)]|nr:Gfo/Idh/MocA family oxidoreductase [Rivularia sp. MS3]